jgi:hypothetical protein
VLDLVEEGSQLWRLREECEEVAYYDASGVVRELIELFGRRRVAGAMLGS